MYQESPQYISIGKAAKLLGVCTNTLLNWEDSGIVTPFKTDGGHRRYNRDDILMLRAGMLCKNRHTVCYCKVPDALCAEELERQTNILSAYCEGKGYQYRVIKDIGSDLDYQRTGLRRLFDAITLQEAERVVLIDENLLCIGNELVSQICHNLGVAIEVVPKEFSKGIPDYQAQDSLSFMVKRAKELNETKIPKKLT